jgi:hypothetical protein
VEELAEVGLKGLLRIIGFVVRGLIWLMWEVCFEEVCWYIGWPVCRLLTFGRLPREPITHREHASNLSCFLVSLVGFGSLIGLAICISLLTGTG